MSRAMEAFAKQQECFRWGAPGHLEREFAARAKALQYRVREGDAHRDFLRNWAAFWALDQMGVPYGFVRGAYRAMLQTGKTRICAYGVMRDYEAHSQAIAA